MKIPSKVMKKYEEFCEENKLSSAQKEKLLKALEERVKQSSFEAGEAIGVIAAQSISEPATQMSIASDEKIILRKDDKINVLEIGEFTDTIVEKLGNNVDGWDVCDISSEDITVPSITEDGKLEWKKVMAVSRHESPEHLVKITTKSGRQIIATDSHSFVVRKNDKIVPVKGTELFIGEKIPVTKYHPKDCADELQKIITDAVWDEITNIDKVKSDCKYVYDLTVEGTETFTTFDGIVTHNTMRSYTLASQSDRLSKVTQGLPRLIEIFDARKTFEKNMLVYLEDEYNNKDKAKEVASRIKETNVGDAAESVSIDLMEMKIEIILSSGYNPEEIVKLINKHVRNLEITARGQTLYIASTKTGMKDMRKIRDKVTSTHVAGVPKIKDVIIVKDRDDWVIQTVGSNLAKVLEVKGVDISRVRTNNLYEVQDVLGIDATRNGIHREVKDALDEQGLDIDERHIMLLADMMTFTGEMKAIGRYGISGEKNSVLARANFEETKKHIVNASFFGEKDKLKSITENIMVGQVAPIGTGSVKLIVDAEKMRKSIKK